MEEKLKQLLRSVYNSPKSNFYRNLYTQKGINAHGLWENLPFVTQHDLIKTPLNDRLYLDKPIFVKIIHGDAGSFLFGRTVENIAQEYYGKVGERPLVAFSSSYEGIEKSLWVYEQNMLPLINLDAVRLTVLAAEKYDIDSIVGDIASITALGQELPQKQRSRIKYINIIDSRRTNIDHSLFPNAEMREIFSLPETGNIAERCPTQKTKAVWHGFKNVFIENDENKLVITKYELLPTPLIRYRTKITVHRPEEPCDCKTLSQTFTTKI